MTEAEEAQPAEPQSLIRLPSHVPGLDALLNGGLFRGGIYLLMGAPGTGKTILANQLCFGHVAAGGRAVYITLLTESHTRLLAHLQSFSFFDPAAVGDSLQYFSGYSALAQDGLEGLYTLLRHVIRTQHATLLVLDGAATLTLGAEGELAFKAFLQRVQTLSELQQCTTLLISHQTMRESSSEQVMADGLIELTNRHFGLRLVRQIEIWKLRGSRYLEGCHHCEISSQGLAVYPRIELARPPAAQHETLVEDRVAFGIAGLDRMLEGGLPAGSAAMLLGVPGSGKTVLGLHFLAAGLHAGEPGLYVGFNETPLRLRAKAARLGLDLGSERARELIDIEWHPASENIPDALVEHMLAAIERRQVRRLFIDGISGLLKTLINPERTNDFFATLANELRLRGVTTVFASEMHQLIGDSLAIPQGGISETAHTILCLRYVEIKSQLRRLISILKMSDGFYDSAIYEFEITPQGLKIANRFADVEALLTGVARPYGPGAHSGTAQANIHDE